MIKHTPLYLALTAVALSVTGCQESAITKPPGTYERTVRGTDANGTAYEKSTTTDVSVDSQGKKKAVVKTTTETDPKGLMNKSTSTEVKSIEEK